MPTPTPLPPLPDAPWRVHAPAACAAFDHVESLVDATAPPPVLAAVRRAVAGALAHPEELDRPAVARSMDAAEAGGDDPRVPVCVAFAEQFVVDVAAVTDDQRAALGTAMGDATFPFVAALYVIDVFQRARIALSRVFGTPWDDDPAPDTGELWPALEEFMRVVARGDALDPLTTELVRLRGARVHECRICQSRLSVKAVDAAGGTEAFDALDDYEHADFTDRHKAALRLTDALVTQPAFIDDELVADVQAQLTDAEIVEIVLDVTRNAANKVAVATGGDAPVVEEGFEWFDVDTTGEVVADVEIEVVRLATGSTA